LTIFDMMGSVSVITEMRLQAVGHYFCNWMLIRLGSSSWW
jgi:hypothetical protein